MTSSFTRGFLLVGLPPPFGPAAAIVFFRLFIN
jgi:hypothetical protein